MFIALSSDNDHDEDQFLCTAPINFAQLVTLTGIAPTSEGLIAQTVHAFSHFVSKAQDFAYVVTDISC
jgi:hypothetical protein